MYLLHLSLRNTHFIYMIWIWILTSSDDEKIPCLVTRPEGAVELGFRELAEELVFISFLILIIL